MCNVRPSYPWASFGDCVVYSFATAGRDDQCVMFWDTSTDERHLKHVRGLLAMCGSGEHCALVATAPEPEEGAAAAVGRYIVVLCNSIGTAVETRYINVEPTHLCMTPHCVVVASRDALYMWSYRAGAGGGGGARGGGSVAGATSPPAARREVGAGKERLFSVANVSVGAAAAVSGGEGEAGAARPAGGDGDICCVTASARWLLVGRDSGAVQLFSLPGMVLEQKFQLRVRPAQLQLNCDGTQFSVIDGNCTLSFFDMTKQAANASGVVSVGEHLEFEKPGVWVRFRVFESGAKVKRGPHFTPPLHTHTRTHTRAHSRAPHRASRGPRTIQACTRSWRRHACTCTARAARRSRWCPRATLSALTTLPSPRCC